MTPVLHIRLFGACQLIYGDQPVGHANSARLQSLLAYLLLHADTPQPRQHLAFLLWPESSESQAHSNLRKLFYQLRQALPDADRFLQHDKQTIQWNPKAPYTTDVEELDQLLKQMEQTTVDRDLLTRLAELYTGELLPNCYDEWVVPLRQRYARGVHDALARLITLCEHQRAYAEGARYAQQLLALDPLEETSYQRLMRLRTFKGDRAGALRVYHDCVTVLKQELGVEPSAETQQTYERILNQTLAPPARATEQPILADTVPLVGRTDEWQRLCATWQRAARGHAQFMAITGEAGIGKTRLAEELLRWLGQRGVLAARSRSYAAQGDLAYAPITELLRTEALRARLSKLSDVWLAEISRLVPDLLASRPALAHPGLLTEGWQRQRFFEALARAVLVDEQPLLLLFDDLHWCDQETLQWLHYLLQFAPQARLLVVGTVRIEEVERDHPLNALQLGLQRNGRWTEIALTALSRDEVESLAGQVRGSDLTSAEVDRLYHETEGNPLFVVETMRTGAWRLEIRDLGLERRDPVEMPNPQPLPPEIYAVIRARLAQLSAQAEAVASLAATIGRSFTFDVLAAAINQDEEVLVTSLEELWQRRIVREQGPGRYDFSHDRIREVAYAAISQTRQQLLHRQVANALETVYANRLYDVSGRLAVHWEQAGQSEKAVVYYQQTAETARQIHANQVAIGHFQQALALVKQLPATAERSQRELHLLIGLGAALKDARGPAAPEVERTYQDAWQLGRQVEDSPALLPVLHGLTECYRVGAAYQKALDVGEQFLALAQRLNAARHLVIAHFQLGATSFTCGNLLSARRHLEQGVALAPSSHTYARLYPRLAHVLWILGYPDQALDLGQESLRLARDPVRPFDVVDIWGEVMELRLLCGEFHSVMQGVEEMLALVRKYDFTQPMTWATYLRGWALALQGDAGGVGRMHQALEGYLALGGMTRRTRFLILLAELSMHTGQLEKAGPYLDEADALIEQTDERFWEAELYRLRGERLLWQDEDERAAAAWFQRALDTARHQQARSLELRAATCLSRLWQRQGRHKKAHELLSSVYDWFTEGFATQDVRAARALLASLWQDQ